MNNTKVSSTKVSGPMLLPKKGTKMKLSKNSPLRAAVGIEAEKNKTNSVAIETLYSRSPSPSVSNKASEGNESVTSNVLSNVFETPEYQEILREEYNFFLTEGECEEIRKAEADAATTNQARAAMNDVLAKIALKYGRSDVFEVGAAYMNKEDLINLKKTLIECRSILDAICGDE